MRCYLRLSDNTRACEALCQCLPDQLKDDTFATCLKVSHRNTDYYYQKSCSKNLTFIYFSQDDKSTKHWLAQLLKNIEAMSTTGTGGGAGAGAGGVAGGSLKAGQQAAKLSQPVL